MRGQDLFHVRVFQDPETTEVFYKFIANLRRKIKDDVMFTSATHKFIRVLRDGGRLIRCYTQNIDGLERREGMCMDLARGKGNKRRFMKKNYDTPRPDEPEQVEGTDLDGGCEVVQLHGELTRLRCTMCSSEELWTHEATELLLEGCAPKCNVCATKSEVRQATGKRGLTVGALRPNIVLYGEEHPQNTLLSPLVPYDISCNPEILIIMGTSLKVHGLQKIIRDFAKAVHSRKNGRVIFVNNTKPAESVWDGIIDDFVSMDCDAWVKDLKVRREEIWMMQGEIKMPKTKASSLKGKQTVANSDKGDRVPPSKRARREPNFVINIPKWDHVNHRPIRDSPKARGTPWKKRKANPEPNESELLLAEESELPTSTADNESDECEDAAEISEDGHPSISSPSKPPCSPITPTCSSISLLSPRSTGRSIVSTPSRLRFAISAEGSALETDKENSNVIDNEEINEAYESEERTPTQRSEEDTPVLSQGRTSFIERISNVAKGQVTPTRPRLDQLTNKSLLERIVASLV